jgi:putative transcriptional regulator
MPIIVNLDLMLARRKMRSTDLANAVGITPQNLSVLKTGRAKAIRFSTLEAICCCLNCQPGDILEYQNSPPAIAASRVEVPVAPDNE